MGNLEHTSVGFVSVARSRGTTVWTKLFYRFEDVAVSRSEGALYFTWQHPKVDCSPFSLVLQAKEQIGNRTYVNPLVHFVCEGKVQVSFLTDNVVR